MLDISSDKDAALLKDLLKRFKGVEVSSFATSLSSGQIRSRIEKGLQDADRGNTKPWKEVKSKLLKQIKSKAK